MTRKPKTTTDAVEIIHRRYFKGKPERLKALEEARADDEVARKIFELRTKAGLTQAQLAKVIGTTASVICRLKTPTTRGTRWRCSAVSRLLLINVLRFASLQFGAPHRRARSPVSLFPGFPRIQPCRP